MMPPLPRPGLAATWVTPPPPPPPPGALPPPDPWAVALNTGMPASAPPGSSPWEADPNQSPRYGAVRSQFPGWAPPDPAAVSGPPWPALVASGSYTPPPFIRWPIVAGVAALLVVIVVLVAQLSAPSRSTWLGRHQSTINTLNRDQRALQADNPTNGGNANKWLTDWRRFHTDALAAASLPNPGGTATVPWREMLNDYANESAEIIQAITSHNPAQLGEAERDLQAGNQAARQFDHAMGVGGS